MVAKQTNQQASKQGKATQSSSPVTQGGGLAPKPAIESIIQKPEAAQSLDQIRNVSKSTLTRIEVSQLPKEKPDFRTPGKTKDALVTEYLTAFITEGLANKSLTEAHLLPRKQDISKLLGISVGTVQNAIRVVEDMGHVESKQRIGTLIRDVGNNTNRMRKLTSKREQAVLAVKKFIIDRKLKVGTEMPSAREISDAIGAAANTTRLAMEYLTNEGILHSRGTRGNKANWELIQIPVIDESEVGAIASETLIDQLERDLKEYISTEMKINDKLPSHLDLAEQFKVSIKTVHDAMKRLAEQGIIKSKRGRYGTFICRKPDTNFAAKPEDIFVSVDDDLFYNYEKVELHLKKMIKDNHKAGDKLPPMGDIAKELDVSSNTIRKALQNLGEQGIVSFTRGRYGGTFVKKVPTDKQTKTFEWVSINPETVKSYRK